MKKINQIMQQWPPGTVITTDWLKEKGVYKQLVDIYENSGWIERVGRGAYKRKGDEVSWPGGLYALQKLQERAVHLGGKTALELQGFGHYIKMRSKDRVVLWKTPDVRLPAWFQKYDWEVDVNIRSVTLFAGGVNALTSANVDQIDIETSTAERAILEYLYDVPTQEGFDEANYLMEGLTTLRPRILQELLENCKSIRVKRLFMFMAEYYGHTWFQRLDSKTIDFGKGKREIVKGGKLDHKYQIVVPELSREDQ